MDGYELQVADEPGFGAPLSGNWISLDSLGYDRELFAGIPLCSLNNFAEIQQGIQHYWRVRPMYHDWWRTTLFAFVPGEFILVSPPDPPQVLRITVVDYNVSLEWEAVKGDYVYYIIYSSADALFPFPEWWQVPPRWKPPGSILSFQESGSSTS